MKEILAKLFGGILAALLLGSLVYLWLLYEQTKLDNLYKYGKKTECEVIEAYYKSTHIKYNVNGKEYIGKYGHSALFENLFTRGEKYEILYNPKNPREFEVFEYKKVIPLNMDVFDSTYTKKFYYLSNYVYEYYFNLNNQTYYKRIRVSKKIDNANLDVKKKYLVKYNPENPQYACIFFEDKWY